MKWNKKKETRRVARSQDSSRGRNTANASKALALHGHAIVMNLYARFSANVDSWFSTIFL